MDNWTNESLDQELGKLLGDTELINYSASWALLMPVSIKYGAFVTPMAWEDSPKKYRAVHIALDNNGCMTGYGGRYESDDNDPARCLIMTLIKILKKNGSYSQ